MKIYTSLKSLPALCLLFSVLLACKPKKPVFSTVKGYDFKHPEKFNMPESLHEISGIAFYKGRADTVYAIQDEEGRLFRLGWGNRKQQHAEFGKKGDYEDLAILHETVIVLKSNGTFYLFPFSAAAKKEISPVKEHKGLLPKGEYESIYADQQTNQVYVLCKNCKEDKKQKVMSGHIFTYNAAREELIPSGNFTMDISPLVETEQVLRTGLKASAVARDPHSGEWYILSSVNKLLVVASPDWKIKATHRLNSATFIHPEGIAFDAQQNLYISNEGDEFNPGNILKFTYQPSK